MGVNMICKKTAIPKVEFKTGNKDIDLLPEWYRNNLSNVLHDVATYPCEVQAKEHLNHIIDILKKYHDTL